jgi:hypothetical protein
MRKLLIAVLVLVAILAAVFWYFSTPDIPRASLEAKYATPPSQFTTVDWVSATPGSADASTGARVHYRDRGAKDAPVLMLLHGSNASLFTWERWSKTLSDRLSLFSVDLP